VASVRGDTSGHRGKETRGTSGGIVGGDSLRSGRLLKGGGRKEEASEGVRLGRGRGGREVYLLFERG